MPAVSSILLGGAIAGGLGSSLIASKASSKAASAQMASTQDANALSQYQYEQTREDLAPWRMAGGQAVNTLSQMTQAGPGQFKESPSYQFTLGEGMKGIQRQASGLGRLQSGEYLKGITGYAENMASTEYQNFLNRYYQSLNPYQSLAGLGQTSTAQGATLGQNATQYQGQNTLYAGQAQAGNAINQGNIYSGLVKGVGQNALYGLYGNQGQTGPTGGYYNMPSGGGQMPWYGYY